MPPETDPATDVTTAAATAAVGGTQAESAGLFDLADDTPADKTPDQAPQAAAPAARPDFIPEQFWDAQTGQPRLEQLGRSWSDLRTKIARGEGKPPEKPDAYALPQVEGMPADAVKPDDPLWTEVRAAAHQAGLTQQQLDAVVKPYLALGAKLLKDKPAAPDPAAEAAAAKVAAEAELAKLGPNGRAVVSEVRGWIRGLQQRGGLTQDEAAALMVAGNAAGVRALAKLRALSGEQGIPVEALAADDMTEADARRLLQDGYAREDAAAIEKGRRALTALEKRGLLSLQRRA